MYTKRPKDYTCSDSNQSCSTNEVPIHQQLPHMLDNSAPSDMDFAIALLKSKWLTTALHILYFLSSLSIPTTYKEALRILLGSRLWMRKCMLSFHRGYGTGLLLLQDLTLFATYGYSQWIFIDFMVEWTDIRPSCCQEVQLDLWSWLLRDIMWGDLCFSWMWKMLLVWSSSGRSLCGAIS